MEFTKLQSYIFNASWGNNTAKGRKDRAESFIDDCDYCEGKGKDIFNREKVCPFCYGSLTVAYHKDGDKIITN